MDGMYHQKFNKVYLMDWYAQWSNFLNKMNILACIVLMVEIEQDT